MGIVSAYFGRQGVLQVSLCYSWVHAAVPALLKLPYKSWWSLDGYNFS
uniref:Uncharacterized protein n=1 Tax=Arundo donax TaxID=35708 RepID=A0A0A9ASE6_ARUDO